MARFFDTLSIRAKTMIGLVGLTGLVMTVTAFLIVNQTARFLTHNHAELTVAMAESLALATEVPATTGDRKELTRLSNAWLRRDDARYIRIESLDGKLLAQAGTNHLPAVSSWSGIESQSLEDQTIGTAVIRRGADANDADLASTDVEAKAEAPDSGATDIGRVIVSTSVESLHHDIARKTWLITAILTIAGLTSALFALLMVNNFTRRLARLSDASEEISRGHLGQSISDSCQDELGRLAAAFESMRLSVRMRNEEMRTFNDRLHEEVRIRTSDLETAMHAAEDASRAKSDFLANMSHEIRTPMNAILGNAELLSEPDQCDADRTLRVQTIQRSGEHLLGIINDILDVSKIEAGKMTVEVIPCSPQQILSEVRSLMEPRAKAKGVALLFETPDPLPATIQTDPMRLKQILLNLLSNSIKFTNQGFIRITSSVMAGESDGELTITVQDTGIGMSPETTARLFRPFEQADNSMSRRFGGTGLGLVIARKLAALLGGDISVTSSLGQGSTFVIKVRTGVVSMAAAQASDTSILSLPIVAPTRPDALAGRRILLVEDGIDNQRLISHHLKKAGAIVTLAENGRLGVEVYNAACSAGETPDMLLMDMQMPEMDGYTATAMLRAQGCKLPIVALTAHALSGDREKCLAAGCNDYATKPVKRETLLALCDRWCAQRPHRHAA